METRLILDRYRPLAKLASGGFADVILAFDTRMQRKVALKRLPFPRDRSGKPWTPVGLSEAQTAAMLNHPSIVTVYEWDTDNDEAFIIMEYLEGISLAELLDEGPLDPDEAAAVVVAVSDALVFAHENGVLHLDIKPENVLVTLDGRIKVTDFGVAALSTSSGHQPTLGGTLGYMPLEQLKNGEVDERTDVWGFASLVFELLAGENPLRSDSIEGAILKAGVIDIPVPTEFDPDLPSDLDDIFSAALSPHAEDRYPNVSVFAARLLPHLGDPNCGHESLAAHARRITEAASQDDPALTPGLWDRIAPHFSPIARVLDGAIGGWLAYLGLAAIGSPPLATTIGVTLAALALAFWRPRSRRSISFAIMFLAPVLGTVYLALAMPMLLGYAFRPLKAALLSALAATLTLFASVVSGHQGPWVLVDIRWLLDPFAKNDLPAALSLMFDDFASLVIIASWAAAASITSLACAPASRAGALTGIALATLVLSSGYISAGLVADAWGIYDGWTPDAFLPHVVASLILMLLVTAAGPPVRAEPD